MISKNPSTVDLRGVDMPEHLKMATQAVEYAVRQGEITVFTDRDIVMKYLPAEAAKNHLKIKIEFEGDSAWKITISKNNKRKG